MGFCAVGINYAREGKGGPRLTCLIWQQSSKTWNRFSGVSGILLLLLLFLLALLHIQEV